MPRITEDGVNVAMGVAGHQGVINGVFIPDSYGPQWYNEVIAVFEQPSDGTIVLYNTVTGTRTFQVVRPSNELSAGGDVWALWASGYGLLASTGFFLTEAGLLDVGPDGAVGYIPNRQADYGGHVREVNGDDWTLTTDHVVYSLQLLGDRRAIYYNQFNKIITYNLPPCTQVGNAYHPKALNINGEWWVLYFSTVAGVVLHPFNSTIGYQISPTDVNVWQHCMAQMGDITKIVWSTTAGEAPWDYRERFINTFVEPRVQLIPVVTVPAINKPCWMGWFEFINDLAILPPANCLMWVRQDGPIKNNKNLQFAQWIQGETVQEINQLVSLSQYPVVAYWDGRDWPEGPRLREGDWICLQAYCKASESPTKFEEVMRAYLNSGFYDSYEQVCLVCQCYTSNLSLTTDLISLVPIYARLARDFSNVNMLLAFSDQGRATGLVDHPEVQPYWKDLMTGITGEPQADEDNLLPLNVYNSLVSVRSKYPTPLGDRGAELLNEVALIHKEEGWGLESKPAGNNCPQPETGTRCGCDILRTKFWGYDVLIESENRAIPVRAERGVADPDRFVEPVGEIPPMVGVVDILYYDNVVARSDPNGLLIRFDVQSPNPVIEVVLDLLNDGEPGIPIGFKDEPRVDGRYCRALAFKPTANGSWTLLVTAKDNQGNEYKSDGSQIVTVTF